MVPDTELTGESAVQAYRCSKPGGGGQDADSTFNQIVTASISSNLRLSVATTRQHRVSELKDYFFCCRV
jgi:guanylate kinase